MKTFKINPSNRGIFEDKSNESNEPIKNIEEPKIQEDIPLPPRKISSSDSIISNIEDFGTGWIIVKMNNGRTIKRSGGSIAWRYNNPGNLKYGPFAKSKGAIGAGDGGHSVFPNLDIGKEAMRQLIFGSERGYNKMTLENAIAKYAPTSDGNDPDTYANYVSSRSGVSKSRVLNTLSPTEQYKVLEIMMVMEGFKTGNVSEV